MKRLGTVLSFAVIALTGSTLLAAGKPCSVHPKKGASKDELAAMAKISQADAQKAALASFKGSSKATVKEGELEAEHGCLIYSFDIAIEGKSGVQEVEVDAGNGKVLSNKHESAASEAAEKAKDKVKPPSN
jgi:predicted lipoprotein with Yx(FWY)xxD motif